MLKHLQSVILDSEHDDETIMADAEKLMQLVMRTQAVGNWRVDVNSGTAWWSPRVYEIHGLEPGEGPVDLNEAIRAYHPTDAKTVAWLVMNAIENKVGFTFVLRLVQPEGGVRLVQSAASVDIDESGEVVSIYGIFKDVTDRCSELDVAEGRGRLVRSIISHSPAPLVVLDRLMHYLEVSPSWADHYGLPTTKSLIGKSHFDIMPNMSARFRRSTEQALRGEIVHSHVSYHSPKTGEKTESGAAIFPWRISNDDVGGIIIMLTSPGHLHEKDETLSEIANLVGQAGPLMPTWGVNGPRPARVRSSVKW